MKILGIQKDHNASACLYIDNELVYYNQEERLSRIKKDSGLPIKTLQEIHKICEEIDVLLISGYNQLHGECLSIISIIQKLGFKLSKNFKYELYYKSHHLTHAANAFYNSEFEDAMIVVWDGRGDMYNLNNGDYAHDTTSIFTASRTSNFELIYRRFFTHSKIKNDTSIIWTNNYSLEKLPKPQYLTKNSILEIRNDFDLGFMYEGTSRSIGFDDEGGKLMSLQSFGAHNDNMPSVLIEDDRFNMSVFKFDHLNKHRGFDYLKCPEFFPEKGKIDFAFDVQKAVEKIGLNLIETYLEKTNSNNLILTGGVALNIVANQYFRKKLPKSINIFIEPMCGDEGNCIGLCEYFIHRQNLSEKIKKTRSIYIGGSLPKYEYNLLEKEKEISNVTLDVVADIIRAGHIVAIFQGKAEGGPRALGNRSLLFDPRIKNGKDIVNTVKNREPFRPFAASILVDHAHEWFNMEKISESPFMMYTLNVRDDKKDLIPAVLHIDGTSRVQTVSQEQNRNFYELIEHFYKKTNIPLLLNTSFNLAGDPIVETVDDAIESLRKSRLEYLYLPEIKKLIYIPN